MMASSRGFSLPIVLLALLLLAVAGASAITVATVESGNADARASYSQALGAADAGLQHFIAAAQPDGMMSGVDVVGSRAGDADANFVWLPGLDTDGDGVRDLESRYRIWSMKQQNDAAGPGQPGWVTVEGQVLRNGSVTSTATLQAVLRQRCPASTSSQYGSGAGGTASELDGGCDENDPLPSLN